MFFEPSTSTVHPTIQHYAAAHPEAAGLDTEAGRLAAGLHRLHEQPPAYDPRTHTLALDGVELVEGDYRARYQLVPLTPEEIEACTGRHRSPLVLQCVRDWLAGRRFPLDVIRHYG